MSINDFVVLSKIGHGSFAQVYKVRRLDDNKVYALKQVGVFLFRLIWAS